MQKQGRRAVWLAEQLGCHRNNVYLIYSRSWIDTEMLMKIATALRHDFFGDLSKEWQKGDCLKLKKVDTFGSNNQK